MSETTTKKSSGVGAAVKGCLGGFKNAPTSTKIAAGVGAAVISVGTFFIGRATKKVGKK